LNGGVFFLVTLLYFLHSLSFFSVHPTVIMRTSAIRAFTAASRAYQQHTAQVTSHATGSTSTIPAFIIPAAAEGEQSHVYTTIEEDEEPHRRRSQEAQDGSARIGMVELPAELQLAVSRLLEGSSSLSHSQFS
jgi:hypothetical protein